MRTLVTLTALLAAATCFAFASKASADTAKINGLDLYYEVHGTGRPVVLLHGAFCTIAECFGQIVPELAKTHKVIVLELQGHGHTADIDRPITLANLADDTAALLKKLDIKQADVIGYSMGGGVAVVLAKKYPALVRKLVLAGTPLSNDGWHPGMREGIKKIDPKAFEATPWHAAYIKVAPKPQQWAGLVRKITQLEMSPLSTADLKAIKSPVLYMIGDSDVVRPEHAVEMFRLFGGGVAGDIVGLPKAQLAVVPGTTHVTLVHAPQFVGLVTPFLDAN